MKKILFSLSNTILSREQMKAIKGGYSDGNAAECKVTCPGVPEPLKVTCTNCDSGKKNGKDCVWCPDDPSSLSCCEVA